MLALSKSSRRCVSLTACNDYLTACNDYLTTSTRRCSLFPSPPTALTLVTCTLYLVACTSWLWPQVLEKTLAEDQLRRRSAAISAQLEEAVRAAGLSGGENSFDLAVKQTKLDAAKRRAAVTSCKLRAASCKLQATSYRLQATRYTLHAHELQATSYKLQATSYKLQAPSHKLDAAERRAAAGRRGSL